MSTSNVFDRFCFGFHQGIFEHAKSLDQVIESALSTLDREDGGPLTVELDKILGLKVTNEDFLAIWNERTSDIYFSDAQELRRLLEKAREIAGGHPFFQVD